MAIFNSGVRGKRAKDGVGIVGSQSQFVQQESPVPTITSFSIDGSDDLALDPAGGQTVVVTGTGFFPGMTGIVGSTAISAVTVVSPTKVTFTSTARSPGSYTLTLANANGSAAILVPGIVYSSVPTFTTAAGSIGTYYETKPISTSVTATSDTTVTYTLASGALPSGATLNSNGTITGTSPVDNSSTTYNFAIKATDAELQDVTRSFTLTINTDVVSWTNPSTASNITLESNPYSYTLSATSAAGYAINSYAANALPSGLSLSNGVISGTPDTEQSVTTLLTATSATTNRSATTTINWTVSLNDLKWGYNTVLLSASTSVNQTSFIADASLNNALITVAGDTKAQNFHPFQHGFYGVDLPASGSYLTGSHSYLNISATTSVWTFECWVYPRTSGVIFAIGSGSAYGNSFYVDWGRATANKFTMGQGNGSSSPVTITSSSTYSANMWYHVAVTRTSAGVITLWINGVSAGTQTYNAATVATGTTFVVNGLYDNNGLGNGGGSSIVSNLRFVTGLSLYSSTFTPSTTPLTASQGSLLLLCQSNTFIDNSLGNPITIAGTPAITAVHPFASTVVPTLPTPTYSYYFNGSSYLSMTNDVFLLGTTWTIEAWIYPMSGAKQQIIAAGNTSCYIETLTYLRLSKWSNGSNGGNYGGQLLTNAWNHVVWMNTGDGAVRGFHNGIPVVTSTGYAINTANTAFIGAAGDGTMKYTGYICNLRVVKGTAVYNTAGFAVPTAPLTAITNTVLLTAQSSTLVDNSSTGITMTQTGTVTTAATYPVITTSYSSTPVATTLGSAYFDGTGDYLSAPASVTNLLSGTWTVEAWCYMTVAPTGNTYNTSFPIMTAEDNAGSIYHYWGVGSTAFVMMSRDGVTTYDTVTGTMPGINQWFHVAVTNVGTLVKVYINGALVGSLTQTAATWNTSGILTRIGALYTYRYATGYISNLRVINGSAQYTSNFVPQFTSPLSNVTNTSLLTLQTNGSHNNNTFIDSSLFKNVVSKTGNTTLGTFSPYGDTWSVYYPVAAYTTIAANPFTFGTNANFTVEAWINLVSLPGSGYYFSVFGSCDQSTLLYWNCGIEPGAKMVIQWYDGSTKVATGSTALSLNTWYHVAYVSTNGSLKMFLNGNLETLTGTTTLTNPTGNASYTTGSERGSHGASAYVSNLRINNTALYSTSFTIPSIPYTPKLSDGYLTAQSNRFIDTSANNRTITVSNALIKKFSPFPNVTVPKYYSTYFDGTGDYVSYSASVPITTGAFTIEGWIYATTTGADRAILDNAYWQTGHDGGWYVFLNSTNKINLSASDGSYNTFPGIITSTSSVSVNTWTHFAVVRDSNNQINIYLNGVAAATPVTYSASLNLGDGSWPITMKLGRHVADGNTYNTFTGYMSNLRVVTGTAVYTSAFTPPTSPLTAISGTILLSCQSKTMVDNSGVSYTLTASGDAKTTTFAPFDTSILSPVTYSATTFGGSMYFDGSGDYLNIPDKAQFDLTGDFTIEAWVYPTTLSGSNTIISQWTGASSFIFRTVDSKLTFVGYPGVTVTVTGTTTTVNLNQWNHVAATRSGTTIRLFVNGVLDATTGTISGTLSEGNSVNVGSVGAVEFWYGYMSDLRIVTGVALYTTNFNLENTPIQPIIISSTANYTSSLLLSGGSGGIIDASRTIDLETVGDVKNSSFTPYHGNYYSYQQTATSDRLFIATPNSSMLLDGDFTVEFWCYFTDLSGTYMQVLSQTGGNTISLKMQLSGGQGRVYFYNGTAYYYSPYMVNPGVWTHFAWIRSGVNSRLYINGVGQTALSTVTSSIDWATKFYIGSSTTSETFYGYMSNLRIVKGTALYDINSATLTVPTAPLTAVTGTSLLTCQSNKYVDNSTNAFTFTSTGNKVATQNPFQVNTGQSYYFNGTTDYITSTIPAFGTGDFTIESWFYYNSGFTSNNSLFQINTSGFGGSYTFLFSSYSGNICIGTGMLNAPSIGVATPVNRWAHFALVRSNGVVKFYLDGVMQTGFGTSGSSADTTNYTFTNLIIGGAGASNQLLGGYLADFRISRVARYTSNFTLPSIPLKIK